MAFPCYVILLFLLHNILCTPDLPLNETLVNRTREDNMKINSSSTEEVFQDEISQRDHGQRENLTIANDSILTPKFRDITQIVREIQPDQIKEDDKNGTQTTQGPIIEIFTGAAETLTQASDLQGTENITTSRIKPFSPSPYLGSVIEEVIEEPNPENRNLGVPTDFIPMRSRQSFNGFVETVHQPPQNFPFHTSSDVVPVLGGSYALHADSSISDDFENTNFNENPFGRIKFPDEKSKYYPLFLNENEIDGRDKPLKFDFDSSYKQYDFPYKIENPEVQKEPHISDKTHLGFKKNKNNENDGSTVHEPDIIKNINMSLPLEANKKYPSSRYNTWKKVAHTFMTFLPIGLMMAALPPRVIKINSTNQLPTREVPPAPSSVNRFFKENVNSRQAS